MYRRYPMRIGDVPSENRITSSANTVGVRSLNGNLAFSDVLRTRGAISSGSADLDAIFNAAGERFNISPNLLKAVAQVESNFRPNVTSTAGAMGIMQLMPGTARGLGVDDPFDPEQNIMGGARYLRQMLDRFDGDVSLALAAYNAGPGAVQRHGGIPPFRETQNYVPRVLALFNGGDINAGSVNVGGNAGGAVAADTTRTSSTTGLNASMQQMLLVRIIEMQMSSTSSDDDDRRIF